jgi:RimJ/RimL family protein N-acetyltransferase
MRAARLSTARLVLDAPTAGDVQLITQYCQDPVVASYTTVPSPYLRSDAEYFVEQVVEPGWVSGDEYTWALRDADGSPLKGVVAWRRANRDLGFWLGGPHRGFGLMAEAVGAVCDWLFLQGEELVNWEAIVPNRESLSVARRAGFAYTGEAPAVVTARDGSHPLAWHGVLLATDSRTPKPGWPA